MNILITILKECKRKDLSHIGLFINHDVINSIQSEIINYSLSTKNKQIQLNAFTITIPINLYVLNLIRVLVSLLEINPNNALLIEKECWNKLFTILFVFKTNAILCSLMLKLSFHLFECKNAGVLRYILLSRGVLSKLIAATIEPNTNVAEKDYKFLAKETVIYIVTYALENETDLSRDLLTHQL